MKFGFFKERLMLSSSTYQDRENQHSRSGPGSAEAELPHRVGRVTSKGWDVDLVGMIQKNWSLRRTTRQQHDDDSGSAPDVLNTGFPNAPADQSALWTRYDVPERASVLPLVQRTLAGARRSTRQCCRSTRHTTAPFTSIGRATISRST